MVKHNKFKRILSAATCMLTVASLAFTDTLTAFAAEDKVSIALESYPDVDIVLTKGITDVNTDSFKSDLTKYLTDLGLNEEKIHITAENGTSSQTDGSFKWQGYSNVDKGRYGQKDGNDANGGYALWHKRAGNITVTDKGTSSDIVFTGNWVAEGNLISIAKMPEMGDGKEAYKQQINFDYNLDFGDSMTGAGLILNGNISSDGKYLECYVMSINNGAANGAQRWRGHKLKDLAGGKTGAIFKVKYDISGMSMTDDGITMSKAVDPANTNILHGQYTLVSAFQLEKKGSVSILNKDGRITIDANGKRVADVSNLTTGDYFGFFEETYQHGCSSCGRFTLSNFAIKTDYRVTYANVLTNGSKGFTPNNLHYVVNVDDAVDNSLSNSVVDLFTENDTGFDGLHFIAWGTSTNQAKFTEFLNKHKKADGSAIGFFVDNHSYADALEKTAKDIYNTIQAYSGDSVVVQEANAKLVVNPASLVSNTATGTGQYKDGKWTVKFNPSTIEADMKDGAVVKRTGKETSIYETPTVTDNIYKVVGYEDVDAQDGTIVTGTHTETVLDQYIKHDTINSKADLEQIGTYVVLRGGFLSDTYNTSYNKVTDDLSVKMVRAYKLNNVKEQKGTWSIWGSAYFYDVFKSIYKFGEEVATGNGYTVADLEPVTYEYSTDIGTQSDEIFYVDSKEYEDDSRPWKFGKFTYNGIESATIAYKEVPVYVAKNYTLEPYYAEKVINEYDPIITHDVPQYEWVEDTYQYEDSLRLKTFDTTATPGTYEIYYEDTLVKSVYEHRKPVAQFTAGVDKTTGVVTINNTSYDLDKYYSVSVMDGNQKLNGIKSFAWDYRPIDSSSWISGKPSKVESGKQYIIRLTVTDADDETATYSRMLSDGVTYMNPVALFDFTGNDVGIDDSGATYVSKYSSFSLDDKSYDPNGLDITKKYWTVKYTDSQGTSTTLQTNVSNPTTKLDKTGRYTYTLVVENSKGMKSNAYSKSITIIADTKGPQISVNPLYKSWTRNDVDVTVKVTDAESGFDYFKYIVSEDSKTPSLDAKDWTKITDATKTITLSEDGQWYVHVVAYDKDGNYTVFVNGSKPAGQYKIDKTAPTIESLDADYESNAVTFTVIGNDRNTKLNKDGSGIVSYAISNGDTEDTIKEWQSTANFRLTKYGTYYVWTKDVAGNVSKPYRFSYVADRVATWDIESGNGGNGSRIGVINPDGSIEPLIESAGGNGAAAQNLKPDHACYYLLSSSFKGLPSNDPELYREHLGGGKDAIASSITTNALENGDIFAVATRYAITATEGDSYAIIKITGVPAVNFDGNGATSGEMADELVFLDDKAQNLTANAFAKDKAEFLGWSLKADGAVVFEDKQSVDADALLSVYNAAYGKEFDTGMITLYAVWSDTEVNETTTIFNTNENGTVDDSVSGNSVSDGNAK